MRAQFSRHFLSKLGRYAGVALQNESFTGAIFDAMIVPGKVRLMSVGDGHGAGGCKGEWQPSSGVERPHGRGR